MKVLKTSIETVIYSIPLNAIFPRKGVALYREIPGKIRIKIGLDNVKAFETRVQRQLSLDLNQLFQTQQQLASLGKKPEWQSRIE